MDTADELISLLPEITLVPEDELSVAAFCVPHAVNAIMDTVNATVKNFLLFLDIIALSSICVLVLLMRIHG